MCEIQLGLNLFLVNPFENLQKVQELFGIAIGTLEQNFCARSGGRQKDPFPPHKTDENSPHI